MVRTAILLLSLAGAAELLLALGCNKPVSDDLAQHSEQVQPPAPQDLAVIGRPGSYAARLSWHSVGLSDTGGPFAWPVAAGWAAERLRALGKQSTPALLVALRYEDRAVAAHLLLSEIWEEGQGRCSEERFDQTEGRVVWHHRCGVMEWKEIESFHPTSAIERVTWIEHRLAPQQLNRAVHYWCERVPKAFSAVCCDPG